MSFGDGFNTEKKIAEIIRRQNQPSNVIYTNFKGGGKSLAGVKMISDLIQAREDKIRIEDIISDTITQMKQIANTAQSLFAFIPPTHTIADRAPFYRKKDPTIQVLGTTDVAYNWDDRNMSGECVHTNCRAPVRFHRSKPLGRVFFFDIDEKPYKTETTLLTELSLVIFSMGFSHFILTETTKGYHVWILEIRKEKVEYYPLFRTLQSLYESDYEFGGERILRLGQKNIKPAPKYIAHRISEDYAHLSARKNGLVIPYISKAHLTLLNSYANMPVVVNMKMGIMMNLIETFARQVIYNSRDV